MSLSEEVASLVRFGLQYPDAFPGHREEVAALPDRIAELETIVRELAETELLARDASCCFCGAGPDGRGPLQHAPDCLWLRAREVLS